MENDTTLGGIETDKQIKRYAEDMARLYQSEKEKRKNLEAAKDSLHAAYQETIKRLVIAAEYRDEDTGDHIVRMAAYSALIAKKSGLPPEEVEQIHMTAPMHDVGKIGVPDHILLKPGKLTREEFETIKSHTLIGGKILRGSQSDLLHMAEEIALTHHEKWNGQGYPKGLAKTEIPLTGRIVAIADVFDALTTRRPYKEPFSVEKGVEILSEERGEHFDPEFTDVFLANMDEVLKIKAEVSPVDQNGYGF